MSQLIKNFSEQNSNNSATISNENLNAINLSVFQHHFLLESKFQATKISTKLLIDRDSHKITEIDFNSPLQMHIGTQESLIIQKQYSAFLGIVEIQMFKFLIFANDVSSVCTLDGTDIFEIKSTSFCIYQDQTLQKNHSLKELVLKTINNIKKVLSNGNYFAYSYDLTRNYNQQGTHRMDPSANNHFLYNQYMLSELCHYQISPTWMIAMIQGYVGHFQAFLNEQCTDYFLISRKSNKKGGTRFNQRGINTQGFVANFAETEQIFFYANFCFQFVIIRGSVPVFFQQTGMSASVKMSQEFAVTNEAFLKHMKQLESQYQRVLILNLLSSSTSTEKILTANLEQHIKQNSEHLKNVKYEYFDFNLYCKGQRFDKANILVNKLQDVLRFFAFYSMDQRKQRAVLKTQNGVVRVNCLDCLDRTNVIQSKISAFILQYQFKHIGIDLKNSFDQDLIEYMDVQNPKLAHPFQINFKKVWADNGDYLSKHYSGTTSTVSQVIRQGKDSILGMFDTGMKQIERFFIHNFEDGEKQKAIDILLGQNIKNKAQQLGQEIQEMLAAKEDQFVQTRKVSIYIVTWNMCGYVPKQNADAFNAGSIFVTKEHGLPDPDIIIIGQQEVVELNPQNIILFSNAKEVALWRDIFQQNISDYSPFQQYFVVKQSSLTGINLVVFAKHEMKGRLSNICEDVVKCGVGGQLGNKGAVVIRMDVDNSSLVIVNCHLESGVTKVKQRLEQINQIFENAFQREEFEKIITCDYQILMGDLNFRLDLPNETVRSSLVQFTKELQESEHQQESQSHSNQQKQPKKQQKHEQKQQISHSIASNKILFNLQQHDQLLEAMTRNDNLVEFREAAITFAPTYKYDKYSAQYDTSSKQRVPGWTDRILLKQLEGNCTVKQLFYQRADCMMSDHRPVMTYYEIDVKKVNESKRDKLIQELRVQIQKEADMGDYDEERELQELQQIQGQGQAEMPYLDDKALQLQ